MNGYTFRHPCIPSVKGPRKDKLIKSKTDSIEIESFVLYSYYSAPMILPFNAARFYTLRLTSFPDGLSRLALVFSVNTWQNNGGRNEVVPCRNWGFPRALLESKFVSTDSSNERLS